MSVGGIAASAFAFFAAGCSGEAPKWIGADGWQAARCAQATGILVKDGDTSLSQSHEAWSQTTDPFGGTTDGRMELDDRALVSVSALFGGDAKARRFVTQSCSAEALADIRRRL
jgi:hypothetical protein